MARHETPTVASAFSTIKASVSRRLGAPEYKEFVTRSWSLWEELRRGELHDHDALAEAVAVQLRRELAIWIDEYWKYASEQKLPNPAGFCLEALDELIFEVIRTRLRKEMRSYELAAGVDQNQIEPMGPEFPFDCRAVTHFMNSD